MVGDNGDNGERKGNDAAVINSNTYFIIKTQLIIIEDHDANKQQLKIVQLEFLYLNNAIVI